MKRIICKGNTTFNIMRINPSEHQKHPWVVHDLLQDFEVEDVWNLPVELKENHSLSLIQERFSTGEKDAEIKGPALWLFHLRYFLGKVFKWDKKMDHSNLKPGSIRERYANAHNLTYDQLPLPGSGDFVPVYKLKDESLAEIENSTVHATIHLGKVPISETDYTVQMAIYVKPKGSFGRLYMLIIKPFRLYIVYPALLNSIKKKWERYLAKETH